MKISLIIFLTVAWVSYADGEPNPGFLLLSSTGVAADKYSGSLGLYGKTSRTWSGAPVWKLNRRDRFLFYNGDASRWVISNEVSNGGGLAIFRCKNTDHHDPPLPIDLHSGWQYADRTWYGMSTWRDDNTLNLEEVTEHLRWRFS